MTTRKLGEIVYPETGNRRGGFMLNSGGGRYYPADPRPEDFRIEDIAHALARINRYGGHARPALYSVAQHSCLVAWALPPELQLQGLMHDAAEALLGDVVKPVKDLLPDYRQLEERAEAVLAIAFGLPAHPWDPRIKHADNRVLMTEKRDLVTADRLGDGWTCSAEPLPDQIVPWPAEYAELRFLLLYGQLRGGVKNG